MPARLLVILQPRCLKYIFGSNPIGASRNLTKYAILELLAPSGCGRAVHLKATNLVTKNWEDERGSRPWNQVVNSNTNP